MIVFTPEVDTTKLRLAYNNDVFRFRSNSALAPLYCDIQLAGSQDFNIPDVNLRLYPDPDGNFFVNFKPYITALINTTNFQDTLSPDLQTLYPQTFLYDRTTAHYIQKGTWFRITLKDESIDPVYKIFDYICGVTQPDSRISLQKNNIYALAPFKQNTTNSYYLKYWQGYPFDVTLYVPKTGPLQVKNLSTLFSMNFSHTGQVKRLFFSDGRTDETLEDILPMQEGFNSLQLAQTSPFSISNPNILPEADLAATDSIYITLQKVPYQCGVYLKWFNALGGYSYWLFEDTYSIDRSTKQLGELDYDNANIEDTLGRTLQIGKESQDTFKIIAELLTPDERTIVEGLLDSPKVYLFTGKPYARNAAQDWVEVTLKTTQARIKNPRQQLTNFTFDVELPVRYTQTL